MKFIKVDSLDLQLKVKVITLNRPEFKNAFHPEMISEITTFFETEGSNSDLIIMRGEGTVFCAGADLNWMKSMVNYSRSENLEDAKKLGAMFYAIQNCIAPTVAVAQGAVFGGALGLLACFDYVFAEEKTRFCFSEVRLGLAPAMISDFILRKISDAFIRPLMLTAEVFYTDQAMQIGLAHKKFVSLVTNEDVANVFSQNGPQAMKASKKLLNQLLIEGDVLIRQNLCAEIITDCRMSQEGQDRLKFFLNKVK